MTAFGEMECLTIRRHDTEEEKKKKKKKSYTFNASLTMGGRTRHACLCVRRSGFFWGGERHATTDRTIIPAIFIYFSTKAVENYRTRALYNNGNRCLIYFHLTSSSSFFSFGEWTGCCCCDDQKATTESNHKNNKKCKAMTKSLIM